MDAAKRSGKQVVYIDLQQAFDPDDFKSAESFHRRTASVEGEPKR